MILSAFVLGPSQAVIQFNKLINLSTCADGHVFFRRLKSTSSWSLKNSKPFIFVLAGLMARMIEQK